MEKAEELRRLLADLTEQQLLGRLRSRGIKVITLVELRAELEKCREALRRQWADLAIGSNELTTSVKAITDFESHIVEYVSGRNRRADSGGIVHEVGAAD